MSNGIGQSHKLGKQNRKQNGSTNNPSNKPSSSSNIHDNFNKNIDITSKESLNAEAQYSTNYYIQDKPADLIQSEPVSIPHKKHDQ